VVVPPNDYILLELNKLLDLFKKNKIKLESFEVEINVLINKFYELNEKEVAFIRKHSMK